MAPKPLPNLYGSKECSPGNITQSRRKRLQQRQRSEVSGKGSHTGEWKKLEGQKGESAVLEIETGGTGMTQTTSPRLLQANTTLMAESEIWCMITRRRSRDKWG